MQLGHNMDRLVGSDNRAPIVRGKRTKRRQRLSPACVEAAMTTIAPSCGGADDNSLISLSPSSTVDMEESSSIGEHQEEDMANCLILLARGNVPGQAGDEKGGGEVQDWDAKGRSKGYVQSYNCKTCGRTFTSFQALGGHRSSHMKKPKSMGRQKPVNSSPRKDCDNDQGHDVLSHSGAKMYVSDDKVDMKMRECSTCGLRFKSGQALGGHMRRHRALNAGARLVPVTSLEITLRTDQKRLSNILPLDLNLPAPEHDVDHYGSQIHRFPTVASQQTPPMLSAAATLVECLY